MASVSSEAFPQKEESETSDSERWDTGMFECPNATNTVDEMTPPDVPDPVFPSCCGTDAFLVEPIEVEYGWVAAFVASIEVRYRRYGLNELQNRADDAIGLASI